MSTLLDPAPLPAGFDIPGEDGQRTPLSVRGVVLTLLKRLEALATRLRQDSSPSSRPPSTTAPTTQRHRRRPAADRRKPGGQPGPPGHAQRLVEPTAQQARCFPRAVPGASVSWRNASRIPRLRALTCRSCALPYPTGCGSTGGTGRAAPSGANAAGLCAACSLAAAPCWAMRSRGDHCVAPLAPRDRPWSFRNRTAQRRVAFHVCLPCHAVGLRCTGHTRGGA